MSNAKQRRLSLSTAVLTAAAAAALQSMSLAGVTVISDSYVMGASWDGAPALTTVNDNLGAHTLVPEGFDDSRVEAQTFKPTTGFTLDKITIYNSGGSGDGGVPTISLHLYDLNNIDVTSPNTITGYDLDLASSAGDMLGGGAGNNVFIPGAGGARLLTFDFDGADQVTLLANHLYAFELRGTSGLATPLFWARLSGGDFTGGDPYTGGNGYFAAQNIDPDTTLAPRGRVAGANRDFLMSVYAVPTAGGSWNVNADGNWSVAGNWTPGVPNGAGVTATLGSIITAPHTVTVDSPQTVGTIVFDNANKYTVSGAATITMDNTAGGVAMNVISGSHDITAPVVLAKDATFTVTPAGSTLTVGSLQTSTVNVTKAGAGNLAVNNVRAASLTVSTGTVTVLANGGDAGTSKLTGALSVAGGASLDMTNNDMVVSNATPMTQIETYVKNARNNGAWTGSGLTSSTARNNGSANTGLGVISGADYTSFGHTGTFSGQSYAASDTLVKYTWNGDTNFSGTVNLDDYVRVDIGFNTHLTGWSNGDFNYSGTVNLDDYVMIDIAFNTQSGTLGRAVTYLSGDDRSGAGLDSASVQEVLEHFGEFGVPYASAFLAAVPEPTALALVAVPALAGMVRRRRRPN